MWRGCDRLFCKREEIATCQAVQSANLSGTGSFQKNDSTTKKFPQHKWEGKKKKTTQEIRKEIQSGKYCCLGFWLLVC